MVVVEIIPFGGNVQDLTTHWKPEKTSQSPDFITQIIRLPVMLISVQEEKEN
jgi:hypothetical protein